MYRYTASNIFITTLTVYHNGNKHINETIIEVKTIEFNSLKKNQIFQIFFNVSLLLMVSENCTVFYTILLFV